MTKKWIKEHSYDDSIILRNKNDKSLTLEAHKFDEETSKEIGSKWYVFPAKDGKGIPNSPYLATNKQDALRELKRLKEVV